MANEALHHQLFSFLIQNETDYRTFATFNNSNYYAMIIEFVVLLCFYRMLDGKWKKEKWIYAAVALCNLFAMYLTGCRTSWLTFAASVPVLFLFSGKKAAFYSSILCILALASIVVLHPLLFPRIETVLHSFNVRLDIWEGALERIKAHPFFGQGPLTYYFTSAGLPERFTHAHSTYLEPLVSFGLIPLFLLLTYLGNNLKEAWHLFQKKKDAALSALIMSFLAALMVHGLTDYTIFWVQTSMLFLTVFSASGMYQDYGKKKE